MRRNVRNKGDGLKLLASIKSASVAACFFDPQYRTSFDRLAYGNEGKRMRRRFELPQMEQETIVRMIWEIARVLKPSAHLFFWQDKFILVEGTFVPVCKMVGLLPVDQIVWRKPGAFGMGYRSRRTSEPLVVFQKAPLRSKGAWTDHSIPDVWDKEEEPWPFGRPHPHWKPASLTERLIKSVTKPRDLVVDPSAGSFMVLGMCRRTGRNFLGCDLRG